MNPNGPPGEKWRIYYLTDTDKYLELKKNIEAY